MSFPAPPNTAATAKSGRKSATFSPLRSNRRRRRRRLSSCLRRSRRSSCASSRSNRARRSASAAAVSTHGGPFERIVPSDSIATSRSDEVASTSASESSGSISAAIAPMRLPLLPRVPVSPFDSGEGGASQGLSVSSRSSLGKHTAFGSASTASAFFSVFESSSSQDSSRAPSFSARFTALTLRLASSCDSSSRSLEWRSTARSTAVASR